MKKCVIAVLVTLFFGSLMGCQNHEPAVAAETSETMVQQFQGIVPCADCEGIQVSLSLKQGGKYVLNEHYLGARGEDNVQQGTWQRTAEKLILVSEAGVKRYFRPFERGLEMMDTEGNPIQSTLNYRLAAVKA